MQLKSDESPSENLKEMLAAYMFEAGIDMGLISSDTELAIQGLMQYHVIDKRRRELNDIAKGL